MVLGDVLKRELCPGEQLVLSCTIEDFNSTCMWIKGNENIFINRRHGPNNSQDLDVIVNVSIGVYELKFTNMSQDDIGVYTCLDNSLTVQTFNVTMKGQYIYWYTHLISLVIRGKYSITRLPLWIYRI